MLTIPPADRPIMPKDYGIQPYTKGMLTWDWVSEKMLRAKIYWVTTIHPANRPHTMPNWGGWVDDQFLFGTSAETRKAKNLALNPAITVSVNDGDHIIIIEGVVGTTRDVDVLTHLDDQYEAKYRQRDGWTQAYIVQPHKVFAFAEFPLTPTRWVFKSATTF
jgi:hypothetical protein